jgi:hypothetical protein
MKLGKATIKRINEWARENGINPNQISAFEHTRPPKPKPNVTYQPIGIKGLKLEGLALYLKVEGPKSEKELERERWYVGTPE